MKNVINFGTNVGLSENNEVTFTDYGVNLADNILHLMEKKGVSDSDIARALGLPYNTIKRITSGETTDPKISTLSLIADFFNVSIDQLLTTNNENLTLNSDHKKPALVPLLSWLDLENSKILYTINANNWTNWQPVALPDNYKLSNYSFAIESRKSMQPRFPQGTIFIINPDERPIDGDIVLIKILQTNELGLRELAIDPPIWQLFSISDNHDPIIYNEDKYQIIGTVVSTILHSR